MLTSQDTPNSSVHMPNSSPQTCFCILHDVPAEVLADGGKLQRPEVDAVFGSECEFASWPDVPIKVVVGAGDRFFPAEFQRRVALDRLGIAADVLPGGHLIALAQPEALASYLLAV